MANLCVRSELAREKMWSRIHLIPLLQAEADRDLVRRHWAEQAREKELMGVETKVYHSDRCVRWHTSYSLEHYERGYMGNLTAHHVDGLDIVLMWGYEYRFVRPTYAVTPQHTTK